MAINVIGVLLIGSSFLIIILIFLVLLAFSFKKWAKEREESNQQRFDELTRRIDETQNLFKQQVTAILNNFNNLLNNK